MENKIEKEFTDCIAINYYVNDELRLVEHYYNEHMAWGMCREVPKYVNAGRKSTTPRRLDGYYAHELYEKALIEALQQGYCADGKEVFIEMFGDGELIATATLNFKL